MKELKIVIKRSEGEKTYTVPFQPKMRVLDALFEIQEEQEPDLAFRWNCGEGICGSCAARVDGKPVLMCKKEITTTMTTVQIGPLASLPVIKDLVTDPQEVYDKLEKLKPYFTGNTDGLIHDEEIKETQEMRKCIDCFICYDSCHVIRNHRDLPFPGPMNIVKAAALDKHPGEKTERATLLENQGLWNCNVTRCCTKNCPQDIKITEDAIIWEKERAVSIRNKKH